MQNTKIEYSSDQQTPVILSEIEQLLPPLSAEQFSALEADILENGCYGPIIVNEDMIVIDGHNRFRICEKHSLPYKMLVFSFSDLALTTQKGRRNLDKWELGKIALKLKPEIGAKARANMAAGGGNHKSEDAKSGLVNSPNPISHVDTRKEAALDRKEVSINRGWKILKTVQHLPPEEQESTAAEMLSAVQEIDQLDAEAERRGKIVCLFCKAYEKAALLTPTLENVRIWVENTRMRPDEVEDSVRKSYELAQTFQAIGDLLKNEGLHDCQQAVHSNRA